MIAYFPCLISSRDFVISLSLSSLLRPPSKIVQFSLGKRKYCLRLKDCKAQTFACFKTSLGNTISLSLLLCLRIECVIRANRPTFFFVPTKRFFKYHNKSKHFASKYAQDKPNKHQSMHQYRLCV